jgi:sugar O-acyltransferase (sialic acid O-acetyltransferase NeuD family)
MPPPVLILGASGTALDALDCLAFGPYELLGVLDDDPAKAGSTFAGLPLLGPLAMAAEWPDARLVDALGSPRSFRRRPAIIARLGGPASRFLTVVHPRAVVSPSATLAPGCLVLAGAVIGPQAMLGAHVQVLPNAVVSHEATVGDWSILATGAICSGRVRLGPGCYVGAGATVIHDGSVGEGALVGMGAVVNCTVPPGVTVVGNPARPLSSPRNDLPPL